MWRYKRGVLAVLGSMTSWSSARRHQREIQRGPSRRSSTSSSQSGQKFFTTSSTSNEARSSMPSTTHLQTWTRRHARVGFKKRVPRGVPILTLSTYRIRRSPHSWTKQFEEACRKSLCMKQMDQTDRGRTAPSKLVASQIAALWRLQATPSIS